MMNSNDNPYFIPSSNPPSLNKIKRIICFGDSNSWGFDPSGGKIKQPWPEQLKNRLHPISIIVDASPGRCIHGEQAAVGLSSSPMPSRQHNADSTLLLIMLGTNELYIDFNQSPSHITAQLQQLITPWPAEQVVIIAPPHLGNLAPQWQRYFKDRQPESKALAKAYQMMAQQKGYGFIDAAQFCQVAQDGVHLNQHGHQRLADGIIAFLTD